MQNTHNKQTEQNRIRLCIMCFNISFFKTKLKSSSANVSFLSLYTLKKTKKKKKIAIISWIPQRTLIRSTIPDFKKPFIFIFFFLKSGTMPIQLSLHAARKLEDNNFR